MTNREKILINIWDKCTVPNVLIDDLFTTSYKQIEEKTFKRVEREAKINVELDATMRDIKVHTRSYVSESF